jgi:hypothetical protein
MDVEGYHAKTSQPKEFSRKILIDQISASKNRRNHRRNSQMHTKDLKNILDKHTRDKSSERGKIESSKL